MKIGVAGIVGLRRSTALADARVRPGAQAIVHVGAEAAPVACTVSFNPWWLVLSIGISVVTAVLIEFAVFPVLRKAL